MSEPRGLTSQTELRTRAPNGSKLTYGFVALCLALAALLLFAGFYDIDLKPQGPAIIALAVLAFTGGVIMHLRRTARHRAARISLASSESHNKDFR